jgi:hypothetical protein
MAAQTPEWQQEFSRLPREARQLDTSGLVLQRPFWHEAVLLEAAEAGLYFPLHDLIGSILGEHRGVVRNRCSRLTRGGAGDGLCSRLEVVDVLGGADWEQKALSGQARTWVEGLRIGMRLDAHLMMTLHV